MKKSIWIFALSLCLAGSAFSQRYSANQAVAIAIGQYNGHLFGGATVVHEGGGSFWAVHLQIGSGYREVLVNCNNGRIYRARPWHVPRGHAYGYWEHHKQGHFERHGHDNGHGHRDDDRYRDRDGDRDGDRHAHRDRF